MGSRMLRGRFSGGIDSALLEYSSSLETDREMFSEDVWGSKAHVLMLARQQIIPKEDAGRILKALSDVEKIISAADSASTKTLKTYT